MKIFDKFKKNKLEIQKNQLNIQNNQLEIMYFDFYFHTRPWALDESLTCFGTDVVREANNEKEEYFNLSKKLQKTDLLYLVNDKTYDAMKCIDNTISEMSLSEGNIKPIRTHSFEALAFICLDGYGRWIDTKNDSKEYISRNINKNLKSHGYMPGAAILLNGEHIGFYLEKQ